MRPKKGNFFMKEMGSFALSMKRGLVHARLEARVPDRPVGVVKPITEERLKKSYSGLSLHMHYIVKCSYFSAMTSRRGLCTSYCDSRTSSNLRLSH